MRMELEFIMAASAEHSQMKRVSVSEAKQSSQ